MKRLYISLVLISILSNQLFAIEPPSGLMTDLIEYTDIIFKDGYRTNLTLSESKNILEGFQVATINNITPKFSWILDDSGYNVLQEAYQIIVGTDPVLMEKDSAIYWDSGKIAGMNSSSVKYQGQQLNPNSIYYWKVKVWDNNGKESQYSEPKAFLTGNDLSEHPKNGYPLQKEKDFPIQIIRNEKGNIFADFGKDAFSQLSLTLFCVPGESKTITIHLSESALGKQVSTDPGGTIRYRKYDLKLLDGWQTYRILHYPDKRNTGSNAVKMPEYIGEVFPFRYVEIEGYDDEIKKHQLQREAVHYPFNENASYFHSSDSVLNKVWNLCKYSIKATSFTGLYVDGDRERIPYEADALINQLGHYAVDREFSMARNTHEYLIYRPTWPTEWQLQSVLMAWYDYMYTGDISSVEMFYDDLKAKTLYALSDPETGLISTKDENQTPEFLESIHMKRKLKDIVDWPHTGILGLGKNEGGEADGYVFSEVNTVVNAFYYKVLKIMEEFSQTLGKADEVTFFQEKAVLVKKSFNKYLLDKKSGIYCDGVGVEHHSLHGNFFPLAFGLVPEKRVEKVLDFIRSRGMACSVYGAQFLMDALYDYNDSKYALQLLNSTEERSWYNMIKVGSTITMEAWDMKYKPNSDWNHAWGAAPANIIPRKLFGIEPIEPGFNKFRIKPQVEELDKAEIKVPTIKGDIQCSWINEGKSVAINFTIPVNTEAEVILPNLGKKVAPRFIKGTPSDFNKSGNSIIYNVGSGEYSLEYSF